MNYRLAETPDIFTPVVPPNTQVLNADPEVIAALQGANLAPSGALVPVEQPKEYPKWLLPVIGVAAIVVLYFLIKKFA